MVYEIVTNPSYIPIDILSYVCHTTRSRLDQVWIIWPTTLLEKWIEQSTGMVIFVLILGRTQIETESQVLQKSKSRHGVNKPRDRTTKTHGVDQGDLIDPISCWTMVFGMQENQTMDITATGKETTTVTWRELSKKLSTITSRNFETSQASGDRLLKDTKIYVSVGCLELAVSKTQARELCQRKFVTKAWTVWQRSNDNFDAVLLIVNEASGVSRREAGAWEWDDHLAVTGR